MVKSLTEQAEDYITSLKEILSSAENSSELSEIIVNAPFKDRKETTLMGLGIIVFMLVNEKTGTIDRIALSRTELAAGAIEHSAVPFREIKIPVEHEENIIARAIREKRPKLSPDWKYFFIPALSSQDARFNQASAGIGCSVVYPVEGGGNSGAITFSFYIDPLDVGSLQKDFMKSYIDIVNESLVKLGKIDLN